MQTTAIQIETTNVLQLPAQEPAIEVLNRFDLVEECNILWQALREFRNRRARSRNYFRGKPNEKYYDEATKAYVDEDTLIENSGRIPYKMNQIAPAIKNLKGQFRQNKTERFAYGRNRDDNDASDMMTEALRYVSDINSTSEIDVAAFVESLISGLYGWKTGYKWNTELNRYEIEIDTIDTTRIFFNNDFSDVRLKGLRIIGEIHDVEIEEIIESFAKTKAHEDFIRERYGRYNDVRFWDTSPPSGFAAKDYLDFFIPTNIRKCRVIEAWKYEYAWKSMFHDPVTGTYDILRGTQEDVDRENQVRALEAMQLGLPTREPIKVFRKYTGAWRVYFLTPYGDVLTSTETPYWHEQHPYTLGFASLVDNEIWGMIEDVIDPQRLVNRLTIAIDYMFGASAKGVLMIPQETIPDNMTAADFANEWTKFNGVIVYRAKNTAGIPNAVPHQITQNSIPVGIFNFLAMMGENIQKQSGVQGAQKGEAPTSGTPAELYNTQVIQGQLTNRDFFDSFFEARRERDKQICKLVGQYWEEPRYIAVTSKRADGQKMIKYSPSKVRDIDFDIVMSDTADTPAVRQLMEDYLTQMLNNNRLTLKQYLQLSSHPKADSILHVIEQSNPLMGDQHMNPQQLQGMQQQLQLAAQNGDRDAMALLQQAQ